MIKKLKSIAVVSVVALMVSGTGCSMLLKKPVEKEPEKKIETPDTSPQEDEKAKAFIGKYFETLYGQPLLDYTGNLMSGSIPNNIMEYISKKTIDEGNNNTEIPINLPRIVEINGMTINHFELLSGGSNPVVDSAFLGKKGESFLYFVKVNLKGKCLANPVFDQYFQLNNETKIYGAINGNLPPEEEYDYIKVQAKYDVELVKDGEAYKIRSQKEANFKPILEKRISKLNNEFLKKLPYLDIAVEAENKIYEEEKAIIEALFNNLVQLDKQRMTLLKTRWQKEYLSFMEFISMTGVNKFNEREILFVDDSYKTKFNIDSFPIQINMERINSLSNMSVTVHPGYTYKNKYYFVKFDASIIKSNGMLEDEEVYSYDYLVTMKKDGEIVMIDSMKLNEYYKK